MLLLNVPSDRKKQEVAYDSSHLRKTNGTALDESEIAKIPLLGGGFLLSVVTISQDPQILLDYLGRDGANAIEVPGTCYIIAHASTHNA